jgi:hypothetical protein
VSVDSSRLPTLGRRRKGKAAPAAAGRKERQDIAKPTATTVVWSPGGCCCVHNTLRCWCWCCCCCSLWCSRLTWRTQTPAAGMPPTSTPASHAHWGRQAQARGQGGGEGHSAAGPAAAARHTTGSAAAMRRERVKDEVGTQGSRHAE